MFGVIPLFVWVAMALAGLLAGAGIYFGSGMGKLAEAMNGVGGWILLIGFGLILFLVIRSALVSRK